MRVGGQCNDEEVRRNYSAPTEEDLAYVDQVVGRCKRGEYLVRPVLGPAEVATRRECRRCPPGLAGLDGVTCGACAGALEEPYWLDQASCVCKAPAQWRVSSGGGVCVCPDGWEQVGSACQRCRGNTSYGVGGRCFDCGAGNFSGPGGGATACERCAAGTFRLANASQGCERCAAGWYAVDVERGGCAACNRSCAQGWRDAGSCVSYEGGSVYRRCEPCWPGEQGPLGGAPQDAVWRGECVFECNAGFYLSISSSAASPALLGGVATAVGPGRCEPCSTAACPGGRQWEDCTRERDRRCEAECGPGSNGSKPLAHARWAPSRRAGECPWECEDGYEAVRSDYWLFAIYECAPTTV